MQIFDIRPGQRFSFDVYPSMMLGNNFKNVKMIGIFDATMARSFADIDSLHANVYPTLPPGSPDNPNDYSYMRVQHIGGEYTLLGIPYIKPDSVKISGSQRIILTFENKNEEDLQNINLALSAVGHPASNVRKED